MIGFRRFLFFTLTAIYLVVCPLLILYSLGYVYNPVKQNLVRTGVLSLSTIPSDAAVFLEKSKFIHQTPTTINELLPGEYKITLRKSGYKNWTHTVAIEGGKALNFEKRLLIPQQWPVNVISREKCKNLYPLDKKQMFLYSTDSNLGSFQIYGKDKTSLPLVDKNSIFADMPVEKVYNISENERLFVSGGAFFGKKVLYLDLNPRQPQIEDVTDIFKAKLPEFLWQSADDEILYTIRDGSVSRIDMNTKRITPDYMKGVKGFGISDKWAYLIDPNDVLLRHSLDGEQKELLLEDKYLTNQLFSKSPFYNISIHHQTIVFMGSEGDLVVNMPPYSVAASGVGGFSFHNDKLLFFYTNKTISLVDFSGNANNSAFQERFTLRTLFEGGTNIRQCFRAYRDSHILFSDDNKVYLLEIQPQGISHIEPVCGLLKGSDVYYDENEYILYYLSEQDGKLSEIEIIP